MTYFLPCISGACVYKTTVCVLSREHGVPDARDRRVVERVKAWRIGVTVLGLLGLFVGLYSSRLPVGLTVDLMACPYNYNKLDTKYGSSSR